MTIHISATVTDLGQQAADFVAQAAAAAIAARGRFTVALSGGSLPKLISPALIAHSDVAWSAWHVFWADERCVPLDDPDSNYRLAREELFQHVAIPSTQIYPIEPALLPAEAARAYEARLRQVFGENEAFPRFDLILLGMGEDGHTASLFPGHPLLHERDKWVAAIFDSPKPPPERLTLTLPVLNNARRVAFVTAGAGKATVLPQVLSPAPTLPAGRVQPSAGSLHWFIDAAAAASLTTQ